MAHYDHKNFHTRGGIPGANPNRDGVGQESSVPIYFRARWAPSKAAFVDFYGGIAAGGKLRIEKEHGGKINATNFGAAPIVGLRGQLLF